MHRPVLNALFALTVVAVAAQPAMAATLNTTDFIVSPTNFNGFEGTPQMFGGFGPSYTEDGISVTQANMGGNAIWTTYLTPTDPFGYVGNFQGNRSWYPYGGDNGYTVIRMASNAAFGDVSFLVGSGYYGSTDVGIYFELALAGNVVQSGTTQAGYDAHWLGFQGGGFDEIRLRDNSGQAIASLSGGYNALAVDSIKVSGAVPEPETYALMALGLGVLGLAKRRRRAG